jgi:hypothetical protein
VVGAPIWLARKWLLQLRWQVILPMCATSK